MIFHIKDFFLHIPKCCVCKKDFTGFYLNCYLSCFGCDLSNNFVFILKSKDKKDTYFSIGSVTYIFSDSDIELKADDSKSIYLKVNGEIIKQIFIKNSIEDFARAYYELGDLVNNKKMIMLT